MAPGNGPSGSLVEFPELPKLPEGSAQGLVYLVAAILLLVVAFESYYQIAPYEEGVVLRFGKYTGTTGPGPHLKIPFVDDVYPVPVQRQLKEEFGFRTVEAGQRTRYAKEGFESESLMLTGDLNIADVEWVVQYRIEDPHRFLFEVREVPETIRDVAEAEMRGVVGDLGFDRVIKTARAEIETEVRTRMQEILDEYGAGVSIKLVQLQDTHPPEQVKDSFEEVNRSLQEMERAINEALQERNKVIFRVEGEAKERIAEAEGYEIERVNRAEGEAERFRLLLSEYRKAPAVTRQRLYLESMQRALPKAERILVFDEELEGMLPLLDLSGRMTGPPSASPTARSEGGGS